MATRSVSVYERNGTREAIVCHTKLPFRSATVVDWFAIRCAAVPWHFTVPEIRIKPFLSQARLTRLRVSSDDGSNGLHLQHGIHDLMFANGREKYSGGDSAWSDWTGFVQHFLTLWRRRPLRSTHIPARYVAAYLPGAGRRNTFSTLVIPAKQWWEQGSVAWWCGARTWRRCCPW